MVRLLSLSLSLSLGAAATTGGGGGGGSSTCLWCIDFGTTPGVQSRGVGVLPCGAFFLSRE